MPQFQRKTHRARRILDAVAHAYPGAWQAFDNFRRQRGASPDFDWPDWCYMPIAGGYAVASGGGSNRVSVAQAERPAILTALGTWRMTQGIYRFDPALLPEVLETPLDGDIPVEHLQRLPEWCVYVDLEDSGIHPELHGAWMHMECDLARGGRPEFRVLMDLARDPRNPLDDLAPLPLPLAGSVDDSLGVLAESATAQAALHGIHFGAGAAETIRTGSEDFRPFIALALYLCADADITRRGVPAQPSNPAPRRTRAGWQLFPADGPAEWDVGTRIGAALRAAYAREERGEAAAPTGTHVRPHVRRAHWHTIVSGPRVREGEAVPPTERRRDLRWLPPIPVNMSDVDKMPAVIHRVKGVQFPRDN